MPDIGPWTIEMFELKIGKGSGPLILYQEYKIGAQPPVKIKQIKVEEQCITNWTDILKENNIEDSTQIPDETDSASDSDSAS